MTRTAIPAAAVVCAALLCAQAPQIPPGEITLTAHPYVPVLTLTAQSNLVQVPVVVRDDPYRNPDRTVGNLTAADFVLLVDGKPQPITGFSVEHAASATAVITAASGPATSVSLAPAAKPRSVIWFFDDFDSNLFDLGSARQAAQKLLAEDLASGERVGLFTASGAGSVNLTSDRARLEAGLAQIAPHAAGLFNSCPILTPNQAYEIVNQSNPETFAEAVNIKKKCVGGNLNQLQVMVREQADEAWTVYQDETRALLLDLEGVVGFLGTQPGERVIVLASAGYVIPTDPLRALQADLVASALRNHVVINAIDAKGLVDAPPPGNLRGQVMGETLASNGAMWDMATGTGGQFQQNSNDLKGALRSFSAAPRTSYLLSFVPAGIKPDGSLHKLQVKVTARGDFTIQARTGFLSPAPASGAESLALQTKLRQEVFADDALAQIPALIRATAEPGAVHVAVAIDPRQLGFSTAAGRRVDEITVVSALLDADGKFASGTAGDMQLRLKPATLAKVSQPGTGITAGMRVAAAAGTYRLRVVIAESGRGQLATLTQPVKIP